MSTEDNHGWETVTKPQKKLKDKHKKAFLQDSDSETDEPKLKKINLPNLARDPSSPTQFDALKPKIAPVPKTAAKTTASEKKPAKKNEKPAKKQLPSLQTVVGNLNYNEFETVLAKDKVTFPDNESVWMKDMSCLLNVRLDKVQDEGPVFEEKPIGYPVCYLPADIRELLASLIHSCSQDDIQSYVIYASKSASEDVAKGLLAHGHRILLQLTAIERPDAIIETFSKNLHLIRSNQSSPKGCLVVMWAMGQVGVDSMANGLTVWRDIMLPLITIRSLSSYCVNYLAMIFSSHKSPNGAYDVFNYKSFFPIMDLIWSAQSHLNSNMRQKLMQYYPKIKSLAYGPDPSSSLRYFFPSFLVRLGEVEKKTHRAELLASLVECLGKDTITFSVWRQLYTKHLLQSSILLQHILDNSQSIGRQLDVKSLMETVHAFNVTNKEMSPTRNKPAGYSQCVQCCKEILSTKMSRSRFSWSRIFFVFALIIAALVTVDTYTSKDFKRCRTMVALKQYGVLAFLEQIARKVQIYGNKCYVWSEKNLPYYYKRTSEAVSPYLQLVWLKIYELGILLVEYSKPMLDWLNQKVPQLLQTLQDHLPWWKQQFFYYTSTVSDVVVTYSLLVWNFVVLYVNIAVVWLQENVFVGELSPENLQKHATNSLLTIRGYMMSAYGWGQQVLAGDATKT